MDKAVPKFGSFPTKAKIQTDDKSVPKFASFPPKVKDEDRDSHSEHLEKKKNRHHHEAADRSRRSHHHESHRGRRVKDKKSHEALDERLGGVQTKGAEPGGGDLFIIDRKGDSGNITYGQNSKHRIPNYRSFSARKPLGDVASGSDLASRPSLLSSLPKEAKSNLEQDAKKVGPKTTVGNIEDVLQHNFMPFRPNRKRKRSGGNESLQALDSENINPEGETAAVLSEISYSSEEISSSGGEAEPEDPGSELRQRHASLLRSVKEDPKNVQAWIDHIEFQAQWVLQDSRRADSNLKTAERRSIAEVRISLYEDALKQIDEHQKGRESLLIGLLTEGSLVWESKKLLEKWQAITRDNPHCLELQLEYLNLIQTKLSFFSYENCRDQYLSYLNVLRDETSLNTPERADRQLYTVLRLTSLMFASGFRELSRCIWQALIEINCLGPNDSNFDLRLSSFEAFWDNEYARVGEDEARGWQHSPENGEAPEIEKVPEQVSLRTFSSKISSWFFKETSSMESALKPARTLDDNVDENDPYRVVLFSDIKPFLVEVQPAQHPALIDAFLCFHQLPSLSHPDSRRRLQWWHDPFLAALNSRASLAVTHLDIRSEITTSSNLFGRFQSRFITSDEGPGMERIQFVGNVLRALAAEPSSATELQEYYLAFETAQDKAKARKAAKAILKKDSTNLTLYNVYGLIESMAGNIDASNHLFSTALKMSSSLESSKARLYVTLLQRTWIWLALDANDTPAALKRLTSIEPTNSSADARAAHMAFRDATIQASLPRLAATASELLALHSYLASPSSPNDLSAAIQTFSDESAILATMGTLEDSALAVELLHQAQASLIAYHIEHHTHFSPTLIRAALHPSLASFPRNTMFLNLYAENERRFRIDDRVRQIANEILRSGAAGGMQEQQSIVTCCFALKTEIQRHQLAVSGSTAHSVRAAFEKAVNSDPSSLVASQQPMASPGPSVSPVIWAAYLLWEVELARGADLERHLGARKDKAEGSKSKSKKGKADDDALQESTRSSLQRAKQVWLRGLNVLPWSKEFVLLGIKLLESSLSVEEVRGYVEMMADKGLRIHCEFERLEDEEGT